MVVVSVVVLVEEVKKLIVWLTFSLSLMGQNVPESAGMDILQGSVSLNLTPRIQNQHFLHCW
jgi:hypothetical protein